MRLFHSLHSFKHHLKHKHKCVDKYNVRKSLKRSPRKNVSSGTLVLATNYVQGNEPTTVSNNIHDYKCNIQNQAEALIAKIYRKPGITRSHIQNVIEDVQCFLDSGVVSTLREEVLSYL
jgi:hypothetical protein